MASATTSPNKVFDELSQTFKEGSSSQDDDADAHSQASTGETVQLHKVVGKPEETLAELMRYKQWLEKVKNDYERAETAQSLPDTSVKPGKEDDIAIRVEELQQEHLEKASLHSVKELAIHRMQLSDSLLNTIYPPVQEEGSIQESEKQHFADLVSRQNELCSDVLAVNSTCQRLQDELTDVRKKCFDAKKDNQELMKQVKEKTDAKNQAKQHSSHEAERLQSEIDRQLSHICIGRNILQGVVVGSGVNWAEDEDLKELVIGLGQPVKL